MVYPCNTFCLTEQIRLIRFIYSSFNLPWEGVID